MASKEPKNRDDGCCGIFFIKYVLVIFNVIFWLSGGALLGVAIWTILAKSSFIPLLASGTFAAATWMLLVTGAIIIVLGIAGCVAALLEQRCLLMTYAFFLMIVFLVEAMAGILAFIYATTLHMELVRSFNTTITMGYKYNNVVTNAVDELQKDFRCCGSVSYEDWRYSPWILDKSMNKNGNMVPDSCCKTPSERCGMRDHPSNIQHNGCINQLEIFIREHLIHIGSVGIGISFLQIFGIIFSCCLARQLKLWEYRECAQEQPQSQPQRVEYAARNSNYAYTPYGGPEYTHHNMYGRQDNL